MKRTKTRFNSIWSTYKHIELRVRELNLKYKFVYYCVCGNGDDAKDNIDISNEWEAKSKVLYSNVELNGCAYTSMLLLVCYMLYLYGIDA